MEYVIEMLNITKRFPGIIANDHINLQLKKGEIHALLGENGAGKSTLMSILFGLYQPDEGEIRLNGKPININNPTDANRFGIGMVHQHFKLVHNFTALENIILGVETTKLGRLKLDEARKKVMDLSEKYKLKIDPDAIISEITVGMQQRVEILKMLYRDNDILIFDEPSAVLTPQEIKELISIMKGLSKEGKSIILITHKLDEIKDSANRCTVLCKGKYIDTVDVSQTSKEELSELMVGRKVSLKVEKEKAETGKTVLKVEDVSLVSKSSHKDILKNINFEVREGEIVCIAGIDGNGQTQLVQVISGLLKSTTGSVELCGQDITHHSIRYRNTHGLSHIPEDRHKFGLVLDFNLRENLVLQSYFTKQFNKFGFLNEKSIGKYADKLINEFDVRSGEGADSDTRSMSGGNQQKAILAREISREHNLLLAVQPTRGLDVGAIEQIHKRLINERDNGKAVLLVSLELDEVLNVSDRILVMFEGEIVADVRPENVTAKELGLYMAGAKRSEGG